MHYLRKHLLNKRIARVAAQEDDIIYGKVGTSASAFHAAIEGNTVKDVGRQGKYLWLVMATPPHPVMHLGMTGWIKFSNDESAYYRPKKEKEGKVDDQWPPRFWKFELETEAAGGDEACKVAFVDPRRLARIRLVDAEGDQLRNTTPLKENGPDPVLDREILTREWLANKMRSKRVPVKALLLDQANISGVGNWVADEVLYHAKIHPEQYSNTFSDEQLNRLHDSLIYVCTTSVDLLAESDKFPKEWLMKYRWDKAKGGRQYLPNGEEIKHITVGGRTSAIVPSVQKKTAAVAGDVASESEGDGDNVKSEEETKPKGRGTKRKAAQVKDEETEQAATPVKKGRKAAQVKKEEDEQSAPPSRKSRASKKADDTPAKGPAAEAKTKSTKAKSKPEGKVVPKEETPGRRRSTRNSTG